MEISGRSLSPAVRTMKDTPLEASIRANNLALETAINRQAISKVTILIDSREQLPLEFFFDESIILERIKLDIGDYGAKFNDGTESDYCFERKSITDLFGTLGKGYKRFKKEIERAIHRKKTIILIIEGSLKEIGKGCSYSEIKGESILKTVFTLLMRYGVYPVFCVSRREMAEFIGHFYLAEERNRVAKKLLDRKRNKR